jgi:hypothetical protein
MIKGRKYLETRIAQIDRRNPNFVSRMLVRVAIIATLAIGSMILVSSVTNALIDNPWFDKSAGDKLKQPYLIGIKSSWDIGHGRLPSFLQSVEVDSTRHCSTELYNWVMAHQDHLTWRQLKKIERCVDFPDSAQRKYLQHLIR